MNVRIKMMIGAGSLALALMIGCGGDTSNGNANSSTNTMNSSNTMNTNARSSVDDMPATGTDYETTTAESGGVKTETRVYKNNPRVARVVITTRDGKRTAKAYSASGEEKELPSNDLESVLAKGGNAIADAAGFVADKTMEAGGKAKEVGKDVVEKGKDVGKEVVDKGGTVVGKVGEGVKTVGEKTAEGAKTVGKKTVQGAKKVGGAVKDAVTP